MVLLVLPKGIALLISELLVRGGFLPMSPFLNSISRGYLLGNCVEVMEARVAIRFQIMDT